MSIESEEELLEQFGSFDFLAGEISQEFDDEVVTIDDRDDDGFAVVLGSRGLYVEYPLEDGIGGLIADLKTMIKGDWRG